MEMQRDNQPLFISEDEVKKLLSWPSVFQACEQALQSVCKEKTSETQPSAIQPARHRISTNNDTGVVFSMLGIINNYKLASIDQNRTFNTIAHKMVTWFQGNQQLEPPVPNILASIFLFDNDTGRLQSIVGGTEITSWRTAACSLVATKYLYFNRIQDSVVDTALAIVGCGEEGRVHALGMCHMFNISDIHLWNRTKSKAVNLATELEDAKSNFQNKNLKIHVHDTVSDCVAQADIIVTATFVDSPLIFADMVKSNAHINAVGAGVSHHCELDGGVYEKGQIYIDSWTGAESELKTLNYPIQGEVGEIINGGKPSPTHPLTIFQSLGMAVEDAAVAQLIVELYKKDKRTD